MALRGLVLAPGLALLAGCNQDTAAPAAPSSVLVEVERYDPLTGAVTGRERVSYPAADVAVVRPFTAAGTPVEEGFRQECHFGASTRPAYPAVTKRYVVNGIMDSPTGQILLGILGFPAQAVTGCQDYFPDRPLESEVLTSPALLAEGKVGEVTTVLRGPDGRLTQRHSGELVAAMVAMSGFASYDESIRYIDDGGRAAALIYGAEAWPESGTYTEYFDGNIVIDLFLLNSLGGLLQTADGLFVSPAAGYLQRFVYDGTGRLAETRTYEGRGDDGEWLTADDVPAADGLTRYAYEGSWPVRVESGLDPADQQPTASYRDARYRYAGGLLQEKLLRDADGRLLERWRYAAR